MQALTATTLAMIGMLLAAWLAVAVWALNSGLKMRREAKFARDQANRLATLLETAPAIPVLVRPDGRLEAPERLKDWLGRATMPGFVSELTDPAGGLAQDDGAALAKDIAAAQRAGRGFSRAISVEGSTRTMLVRGAPAGPQLGSPGSVILWIFDATESQSQIAALDDERKQLRDAFDALSGLIEAAPMPMWYRGPDLRLDLVNSAYVKAVEAASAKAVIAEGIELIETADGVTPMSAAAQAIESKAPLARIVPATIAGERRAMRVVDVPIGPAGVAGFAIDMHELEEARAEHKRFAEAQRDMLDRLSAGVAQFGADRTLLFANQPFLSLFSLERGEIGDSPEFDRIIDRMREAGRLPEHRDFPVWRQEHRDWFQSADTHEENWLLADGTHLRVFGQPLPDGGLLLIFEDRTEQLQLSSARDTLLRVRTATFDNLFEAVGVFASDGRLSLWNSRFRRLWGVEEELLASHPRIDQLMAAVAHMLAKPHQATLVQELVRSATVERKQKGGHVGFADGRWCEFAAIPLPDGNALVAMLDVTDSRRMEQALRDRNEALEEGDKVKTAFMSNMSYELRTPLTSIAGFAEMLAAGYAGKLSDSGQEYAEAIVDSTRRLAGLIDNVLDLTQGEAGSLPLDLAQTDLAALANETVAGFDAVGQAEKVDIAVVLDPSLGSAAVDRRRIGQALHHLIDNAVRHVGRGGRVLVHGDGSAAKARLVVSDNGPGMDARAQALAFDRFNRAEQAGRGAALGLGLPLARQLVEAHGGSLTLISEPGQGTVVTIELPRG